MAKPKQHIPKHLRYTFKQFEADFPTDDICLEHIAAQRWPDGRTKCTSETCGGKVRKHHRVTGRTAFACDHCGNHIFPLAGTIFHKTSTPLTIWFHAMYLMAATRCGISAKQVQRETGVTYKTAWRMFNQIRELFAEDLKLGGDNNGGHGVEMDETYYGGVRKYATGRPRRGDKKLAPVFGIVERKGRVSAFATPDVKGSTLLGIVKEKVLPDTMCFSDELKAYDGIRHMAGMRFKHRRIKHSAKVYVRGITHTNTIEGFWSLVKRGIGGVYHSVSQKHLQSYLNEYTFRYNRRDNEVPMFTLMLSRVSELAD